MWCVGVVNPGLRVDAELLDVTTLHGFPVFTRLARDPALKRLPTGVVLVGGDVKRPVVGRLRLAPSSRTASRGTGTERG